MKKATKKAAPTPAKVLVLRSTKADGKAHGDFQHPLTVGERVTAPDWNAKPVCGGGIHGLLWGEGSTNLLCWDMDAWWQVYECDAADVVEIEGEDVKCKFRTGVLVFCAQHMAPGYPLALAYISANDTRKKDGNSSTDASSGNSSTAASSGDYSTAASSGDYSTAASSGDYSTASASGKNTCAMVAGFNGAAKCGTNGALALAWWDKKAKRVRIAVGCAGEDGIEADTWYVVRDGALVRRDA